MIRRATIQDLPQIHRVYSSCSINRNSLNNTQYIENLEQKGFLLGRSSYEDFKTLIEKAFRFYIYEDHSIILGYLIADHSKEFHDNENKIWLDENAKELYYKNSQSMTIESIAVDSATLHKGIGTQLLETLVEDLLKQQYKYLFSIISISPVENKASVAFHKKKGFKKVAESKKKTLFEIENYSSALYFLDISVKNNG